MRNLVEMNQIAQEAFEQKWGEDNPWDMRGSSFDEARYQKQIELVRDKQYGRVLELGCGAGYFTPLLASLSKEVVALDISETAIALAEKRSLPHDNIRYQVANVMDYDLIQGETWSLMVLAETIYCVGWLYSFFEIGWRVSQMWQSLETGGRFLLVNSYGGERDYLLAPWLIDTYVDLFVNVGFDIEREYLFKGQKNGVELQTLMTLFVKSSAPRSKL